MKNLKRSFFVLISIVVFGLTLTGISTAKTIKWKVVSTWTPTITLLDADKYFVKLANEMCAGELEIKLYTAGEIVASFEVFDAVRSGTVQGGFDSPLYWGGKDSAFSALCALPGGPAILDLMTWRMVGGGSQIAEEVYGKYGLMYFYHNLVPAESGLRGNKAFVTKEDFKGAKIRMSGMIQGKVLADLGASQVMLAGQEIYQALEKGVIDAAEFSTPDNDWALGFQEVTSIWNIPAWHQPAAFSGFMINKKAWDELPPNVQRKLRIVADACFARNIAHFNYESGIYTKKFIDKGIQLKTMDQDLLKEIQKYAYKHILEEAQKNPLFAKVAYSQFKTLDAISKSRDTELLLLSRPIELPDMEALKNAAETIK